MFPEKKILYHCCPAKEKQSILLLICWSWFCDCTFYSTLPEDWHSHVADLVGGEMSVCGGADGHVLVHRGSPSGRHRHASSLPLPDTGNPSIQESLPSVLSRNKLPLLERFGDGLVHRGVGASPQNRSEGSYNCGSETSLVRRIYRKACYWSVSDSLNECVKCYLFQAHSGNDADLILLVHVAQ